MVVEPDGTLSVTVKEQPQHGFGSTRLVMILAALALVGMIIACTAFGAAMLVLRSEQAESREESLSATRRDEVAAEEREKMAEALMQIRVAADAALGEQQCRSLALANQNAVEAGADVVALELLTEVVTQTFRASRGVPIDYEQLGRLERDAREHIHLVRIANANYRDALAGCSND